jgi:hypothetical protein
MTNNAKVKQGTKGRCAEGGGTKLCGQHGRWSIITGTCSETDLALKMRNEGNKRVIDAYITGGQPDSDDTPATPSDPSLAVLCLESKTKATVTQGTTSRCADGGGSKKCGQSGRWKVVGGTCSDSDLALTRDAQGRVIYHIGGNP